MAIRANKYSSPELGQAMENIASMFSPPPAADLVNYAQAAGLRQKQDIINGLRSDPRYKGADGGVLADLFDPTNSWAAQDQNTATARRGQDITASTSITNNKADNQRALISNLFGNVTQDALRPAVPADVAGMFGLPALPEVQGNRSPLSETQFDAQQKQRLLAAGDLTDEDLVAAINGSIPVTNVVGPAGQPMITRVPDAVGKEAFVNKGAEAKPENMVAVMPDGKTQVPAIQGPDGGWYNAQSKERLPNDIRIFKVPQAQGTASDVGLSKPTDTYIEKQLLDIGTAKETAVTLRDMIAKSPASQGIVGWLRGTAQNLIQTGGELGSYFGGDVAKINNDIAAGLEDAGLKESFDTNIPAIEMLANLLAFQYAKTTTGERLSNEMLRASRAALGLDGLDANQANSLARLNQAIQQIEAQENQLKRVQQEGIGAASMPAGAQPTPTAMGSAPSAPAAVEEWARDPATGKLVKKGG